MNLVAIDPGVRKYGVAVFRNDVLWSAGGFVADKVPFGVEQWVETAKHMLASALELSEGEPYPLYIEEMHSRASKKSAWDHLLEISRATGGVGALWDGEVHLVSPNKWTGRLRKDLHQARTVKVLSRDEIIKPFHRALDDAPAEAASEIKDAIGIGLYVLGRTR